MEACLRVLVTGVAGFIGFHVARALMARGDTVLGIDNINDHYARELKLGRLSELKALEDFHFHELDIADIAGLERSIPVAQIEGVVHLAARPGVRDSIQQPLNYVSSNLVGHVNVLELCRRMPDLRHAVYASSSSVYGGNDKLPFSEHDRVDEPMSVYAATKRADELLSHSFAHLYGLPLTGLRFFTVYGPWGRPDMAVWSFTEALFHGRQIKLFNHGRMRRDFTYIDDIVAGVVAVLDRPPPAGHRVYNLGNSHSEDLLHLIGLLERATGHTAKLA
ncbi:unnamed protein product, partial [marine sediment metagenome]